ncbi:MAG: hypothetical protein ACKO2G_01500 [Verrucomicrobiales bacterium]
MIGRSQIVFAALAALLVEVVLLLAIAYWLEAPPEQSITEKKPSTDSSPPPRVVMATLMPVLPVPVPAKLSFEFVDAGALREKPTRPTNLISDADSKAASELPSRREDGPAMPTQDGIDAPGLDLTNQKFSDGEQEVASAAPSGPSGPPEPIPPEPTPPSPPAEAAQPKEVVATPPEELLPLPTPLPRMEVTRPDELLRPREEKPDEPEVANNVPLRPPPGGGGGTPGFQSEKIQRAIEGTLSQRGKASLEVEDTPLGRYLKTVSRMIERDWQSACRRHRDVATPGFLRVNFTISADGRVTTARKVEARDGGEASLWFTLNAVKGAKLPPIPAEVVEMLEAGHLEINFNFLFF